MRIFETSDPNLLLVKEKDLRGNHEYAIERDEPRRRSQDLRRGALSRSPLPQFGRHPRTARQPGQKNRFDMDAVRPYKGTITDLERT